MRRITLAVSGAVVALAIPTTACDDGTPLSPSEQALTANASISPTSQLGEFIFKDANLSLNRNQSCETCHAFEWGTTGPDPAINAAGAVMEGSVAGRFGTRKPPTASYATPSPVLHQDHKGLWTGGNLWDGRATGEKLGNASADQAQRPFLGASEMALADNACVVYRVANASYGALYTQVWGTNVTTIAFPTNTDVLCESEGITVPLSAEDRAKVETEYDNIALSIAAFENSPAMNQFSSKFDAWKNGAGKLTKLEKKGQALFNGRGKCANCHPNKGKEALFTDYTYDNVGVPVNPLNPAFLADPSFVDEGLGGALRNAGYPASLWMPELGKHKVPTMRNVDMRPMPGSLKAFAHNGYFKSLKSIVHFYNTRDVKPACASPLTVEADALAQGCWPAPEVTANLNTTELGNLGLTDEEEDAIVAYLQTLTDGY